MAGPLHRLVPFATLAGHTDRVWHASWHPTLDMLATCGGDRCVRLWMPARGTPSLAEVDGASGVPPPDLAWRCVATLDESTRTIRCCEWSPCGNYLAACSFDSTTVVWKKTVEECVRAARGPPLRVHTCDSCTVCARALPCAAGASWRSRCARRWRGTRTR